MSISDYLEQKWLDMLSGTAFTAPAGTWIQLHTGDPLDTGTNAVATNNTRKALTWSAAATPAGTKAITSTLPSWSVTTPEIYTHWSIWDLSSAGNCLWTGALSSSATVANGDTFQISALTLTLD